MVRRGNLRRSPPERALASQILRQLVAMDWWELTGLVSGLVCVWLLIRQNVLNWPIGLLYALVSVVVFYRAKLYADLGLHVLYCVLNAYGWYYWLRGGERDATRELPVTSVPCATATSLATVVAVATLTSGYLLATHTDAALPYWDSSVTAMSVAAIWMQARKYLESWYVWFIVDVVATGIYLVKDLDLYALLYCVYIGMAFAGWWAWRRVPTPEPAHR
jgi:nicotinamide mononucleotide transporter